MSPWSNFYIATATAAATLMGLLFVAVSVSNSSISHPREATARALSEQALANLLGILLVSLLALIPELTSETFGKVVVSLSLLPMLVTAWRLTAAALRHKEHRRLTALRRHGLSLVAFGALIYAASLLSLGHSNHLALLAAALLLLLSSATMSAWELLLNLGRPV